MNVQRKPQSYDGEDINATRSVWPSWLSRVVCSATNIYTCNNKAELKGA
jgi:hypothetical protein